MPLKIVVLKRVLADAMLEMAREAHPYEMLLLLRGKKKRGEILVEDLLYAPLSQHSHTSVYFRLDLLPMDFSIIGLAHSHPSGSGRPSLEDLHHFIGRVMLILTPPYESVRDIHAFDGDGNSLEIEIKD